MNQLLMQGMPHERKFFLIPLLGLLAKGAAIAGGVASGVAAYQTLAESPGGFRLQPGQRTTALAPYPGGSGPGAMTRGEIERRQAARAIYSRDGGEPSYFRRRRMNVLNPRALRRSIARVKGFSKFAKRVGSYTDPGKSYRLKGFGRKRAAAGRWGR